MHPVGGSGKNRSDDAGAAPSDDVLGSLSGALDLSVGGGHVDFDAVVKGEVDWGTMLIKVWWVEAKRWKAVEDVRRASA